MIIRFTSLLIFIGCAVSAFSQTTLVLQPDSTTGIDANVDNCVACGYDTSNNGSSDELGAIAWTNHGNISNERGLFQFDLSSLSTETTIYSATLSLYWNPDPISGNAGQSTLSGSDAAWIQRITSAWGEHSVTWNNQPTTTTQNESAIPASVSDTESYPDIDVTALVQDMVTNPSQSFGFMVLLQNETHYRALLFASSHHANPALRPKLVINYTGPLPITLLSFSAQEKGNSVEINWSTASEINNDFFTIWRSADGNEFMNIGTVPGAGSSANEITYSFIDNNPLNSNSYYKLSQTDFDGKSIIYNPVFLKKNENTASDFLITAGAQPFNDNLNIYYFVKDRGAVQFSIVNCLGQTMVSEHADAEEGINSFSFNDVSFLPGGAYFIQMTIGNEHINPLKVIKVAFN